MSKELNNLISSLSEDNFKNLIKDYIKEKYKTPHVRLIDGPYDGGNDLEILIGDREIKRNVQVTVQKANYEKKLFEDVEKASKNVTRFSYLNQLDFYISQNISKEVRNLWELKSQIDFGIQLKIMDGNLLSQEAETYNSIIENTYGSHKVEPKGYNIVDKQTKILYDVLTLDKNSVEIKRNFINSYIYSGLFAAPNSSLDEIFDFISPHLNGLLDKDFLSKELNYLRSKQHLVSPTDKKRFELSSEKKTEIQGIFAAVNEQEAQLKIIINGFIQEHQLENSVDDLLTLLYKLYRDNYTIDIEEIKVTDNSYNASLKRTFNDLLAYFTKNRVIDESQARLYAKQLLEYCNNNEYLNKLSTIHLFTTLYSSNKLEKYVNNKKQNVLIDTQILIRLLCVLYNEKFEFSDLALKSVKILWNTLSKYNDRSNLSTSIDYVREVTGHLLEAIRLQKLVELPFFKKMGPSKNIFYNVYLEYKEDNFFEESFQFEDFIVEMLGIDPMDYSESDLSNQITFKIIEIFELSDVKIIYHPTYQNFGAIKREYEIALAFASKTRSPTARENDLRTILHLSTKSNHSNLDTGELNEPFLITWDSAFYDFRKKLSESHPELNYWYIYSPLKVVDRFSVMNFNLNPQSINLNIVALTETNFNYSSKNVSFVDVITSFFNGQDVKTNFNILKKLTGLKEKLTDINEVPVVEEFKEREDDPLTHLLLDLRNYYYSRDSKYKFEDVINLFARQEFENTIVEEIEKAIKGNNKDNNVFESFNELIAKSKE